VLKIAGVPIRSACYKAARQKKISKVLESYQYVANKPVEHSHQIYEAGGIGTWVISAAQTWFGWVMARFRRR
jgi:hypothetical protein